MKKLLLGSALIGALALPQAVQAQKLVCVNGDELLKESHYAQELKAQLTKKKAELIKKYQQKAKELISKLKSLQRELSSGLLSEEAQKQKQEEYMKLQQQLQMLQMEAQQEAQRYITKQLQKLDSLTKAAVKALAKTVGFDAAIDCNALLYHSPKIDITPQVAKVIDQLASQNNETSEGKK